MRQTQMNGFPFLLLIVERFDFLMEIMKLYIVDAPERYETNATDSGIFQHKI